MSNQSIGTTYQDGRALALVDRSGDGTKDRPPRSPRYTHGFNGLTKAQRSPFVCGYLSLVDGKEWA